MSILIKGIDMPKEMEEAESVDMIIYYNGNRFVKEINPSRFVEIDQPWKECSCYQCKHRGTAPYEKPCSVCARNHKDYFEEI